MLQFRLWQVYNAIHKIYNKLISVPDLDIQDQFIKKIEVYEKQIEELQKEIDGISAKKQAILDKYLK